MSEQPQRTKKLKVTCIQMNSKHGCRDENFDLAEKLIREAMKDQPDIIVLPEDWENFDYQKEGQYAKLCCRNGDLIKLRIGGLAKQYKVNIVAGTVADLHDGKIYNTAFVFDRNGECVATYDKIYVCVPHEAKYYASGSSFCTFMLDGVKCGIIICNDLKFPELSRTLAVEGIDILFVPSMWPTSGLYRLRPLTLARAIENQIFVVNCNSCCEGGCGDVHANAGNSAIIDPYGRIITVAGEGEEIISAECDLQLIDRVRRGGQSMFLTRRPELY